MDWSVSSRFSSFNPLPHAACGPGETSRAPATALPASRAVAERPPGGRDLAIFRGAGQRREDLDAFSGVAREAGLDYRLVDIRDDGFLPDSAKEDLYGNDELGPHAQVSTSFATEHAPAANFVSRLRTPPGEPGFPARAPWQGTVHACWPQDAGLPEDYPAQGMPGWSETTIACDARKGQSVPNAITAMADQRAYAGRVRSEPPSPEPDNVASRMPGVTGDAVACLGHRLKRSLVVGAWPTTSQARHACLDDGLQGRNDMPPCLPGAGENPQAAAGAMRHPLVRDAEPRELAAMDEDNAVHPSSPGMADHTGRSGLEVGGRVACSLALVREMEALSTGQGNAENLRCLLDNVAALRRHGAPFRLDLATLIHGRADFQAIGLQWAVRQDDDDLLVYLLQAASPHEQPGLTERCYRLALQTSRSLAIGLLSRTYSQATVAQLIAHGINDGASQEVVCAWLSELDWTAGPGSAEVVLEALARRKLFGALSAQARDFPGKFRQLMTFMYENGQRYLSYAEALLQYAQEQQDALLWRELGQGYFQLSRCDAAPAGKAGKNAAPELAADV